MSTYLVVRVAPGYVPDMALEGGNLTVELDNEHLNQPAQPIYDEKMEYVEPAPHNSLDLRGPLYNARIWRQRKLPYISLAAASVVLVTDVGFATGYTAAGIGRRKLESLRQSLEQGWCARSAQRASHKRAFHGHASHSVPLRASNRRVSYRHASHGRASHRRACHRRAYQGRSNSIIANTGIAIFRVGVYCNAAS
jgi:hypothetical protein